MPIERALRFRLPDHVPARRLWEMLPVAPRVRRISSVYFDTPDDDLLAAHAALRVRRRARRWVQTLKAEIEGASPVLARHKWEAEAPGGVLHVDAFPVEEIRRATGLKLARLAGRLERRFLTRIVRRACMLELPGAGRAELAFDQGLIETGTRRARIREIGFELIEGDPAALLSLVRRLLAPLELQLEVEGEAERGRMLCAGTIDHPRKAVAIRFDAHGPVHAVAALVTGACLRHVAANAEAVSAGREAEALHQLRVGLRRTRTALRLFRALAPVALTQRLLANLTALSPALGAARDAEVYVGLIESAGSDGPAARRLLSAAKRARSRYRRAASVAISDIAFQRLLLDLLEWMMGMVAARPHGAIGPQESASRFARRTLGRLSRRVRRAAENTDWELASSRHALRIRLKRLRYACGFFGGVSTASGPCAGVRHLASLQDLLGELNDIAMARRRLHGLTDSGHALAAARVAKQLNAREAALRPRLSAAWRAWLRRKPPRPRAGPRARG